MLREYFADELCRIMGIERSQLDLEQPLNEIGMDSLLAMELKTNLELRLAFTLPMAAFLERPSVTTLAGARGQGAGRRSRREPPPRRRPPPSRPRVVVAAGCLQPAGEGPPMFCLHPLGGDVNCYRDLARRSRGRPVYALARPRQRRPASRRSGAGGDDRGLCARRFGRSSLTDRTIWPVGRRAGIFSYELARTLREQGEQIGLADAVRHAAAVDLRTVSAWTTTSSSCSISGKFANWFSGSDIDVESLPYEQLRRLDETARWEFALQIAKTHGAVPPDTSTGPHPARGRRRPRRTQR